MKIKHVFLYLLTTIALFYSCKPEFPSWENEAVFPLVNTRMTVSDLIADSLLLEDDDGMLHLLYEYSLTDFNIDTLLDGLDTISSYSYAIPFTITLPPGAQIINQSEVDRLGIRNVFLKTLILSSGYIKISTFNKYTQPIQMEYSIPDATFNGVPFSIFRDIPAAESSGQIYYYEELIDVSGMRWDFFSVGNSYNCFNSIFKVLISPDATQSVQISSGDNFNFYIGFQDIEIDYARGFFGQHQYEFTEPMEIDVFKNVSADQFNIEDVQMYLEVSNNMGIDIQLKLNELKGTNLHNSNSLDYSGPYLNTPINIVRAQETAPEQGVANVSNYTFDFAENSNLKQFVENMPGKIDVDISMGINPLGNVSGGNDFYYGEPLHAKFIFSIPFHFSVVNLMMSDTISLSTDFLKKPINSFIIRAVVQNCFPFSLMLNMNFLDENGQSLCNLPFSTPVREAQLLPSGRTSGAQQTVLSLDVPVTKLEHIRNATQIVIVASANTFPYGENVKIFGDYYIDVQTFAILNLLIND